MKEGFPGTAVTEGGKHGTAASWLCIGLNKNS